jgi:hypothetical protein
VTVGAITRSTIVRVEAKNKKFELLFIKVQISDFLKRIINVLRKRRFKGLYNNYIKELY